MPENRIPHAEERRRQPARLEARRAVPAGVTRVSRAVAVAGLVALGLGLAACGKKGDPEYPQGAQIETVTKPDGTTEKRLKKPSRPFALDGLLN
jgi:predicted small lipoprotein YifL